MGKKADAAKQAKIDKLSAAIAKLRANQEAIVALDISKLVTAGTKQWAGSQQMKFIDELSDLQKTVGKINTGIEKAIADYQSKIDALSADLYAGAYSTVAKYEIDSPY